MKGSRFVAKFAVIALIFAAFNFLLPSSGFAQAVPTRDFTVQLQGTGAQVGRLFILKEIPGADWVSLGDCPFQLMGETNYNFTPLSKDQLSCTFPALPAGLHIVVFGVKDAFYMPAAGQYWTVAFNRFDGACSGQGSGPIDHFNVPVYMCEFDLLTDGLLQVTFDTVQNVEPPPSPTPTPEVQMPQFVEHISDGAGHALQNLGLTKLVSRGRAKLTFPPSPQEGTLTIVLSAKVRARAQGLVIAQAAKKQLGSGRAHLTPSSSALMRLRLTKDGKAFLAKKPQVKLTLQSFFKPPGASAATATALQTILLRRP